MKDSGLEWLGAVPADWKVVPVRALFKSSNTKGNKDDVHLTPSQKYGVLTQIDYMKKSGSRVVVMSGDSPNMKQVFPGDFISHLRSFQGGLELSKISGKVSGAYTVIRPIRHLAEDYFKWLFKSSAYVQGLQTTTDQLRDGQTIRMNQLSLLPLPYPEISEQTTIASYLNQETSKIDLLISKKEQLIEKLLERRQALITQVVTKGLDLDVPMKDSGIEWIGEVPADWNIDRIRHAFRSTKGGVWGNEPNGDTNDFWCVRVADFDRVRLSITDKKKTFRNVKPGERNGRVISDGDILIEKSGGGEKSPVGFAVSISFKETAIFSNFINVLRIKSDQASSFWVYSLAALYYSGATWRSIKQTSGIQNLDIKSYLKEPVVFPPQPDQILVVRNLKSKTESIDKLITVTTSSIALLKERRQALITQVVTGKLDVRGLSDGDS